MRCRRWFHKVCLFYNDRIALNAGVEDVLCPECSLHHPLHQIKSKHLLDFLPTTELSVFLEERIQEAIQRECERVSAKYNSLVEDMIKPEGLSVRVVLNEVGERPEREL